MPAFGQLKVYPFFADSPGWLPLLQESPLCAALGSQQLHFRQRWEQEPSRAHGAAGWEMPLSAGQVSPTQLPPLLSVQAACPAHSSAGCILNTAHAVTEILPQAAPVPSQGLSPCSHPLAALSWAGPVSLGLCFPSLFGSCNFLFTPMGSGVFRYPQTLNMDARLILPRMSYLPGKGAFSRKDEAGGCHLA